MTGEPGRPGRPRRLVADRPGHRHVGRGRRPGGAARARAHRRGIGRRRLPVRDGARLHRLPPRRLPRGRHGARTARGRAFPMVAPYQVFRDAGRRADDRRRQRPAVRRDLRRASACPELVDDARFATNPDRVRTPRRALRDPGAAARDGRHGALAAAAHARQASLRRPSRTSPTSSSTADRGARR